MSCQFVQSGYCGEHSAVVGHTGCCNLLWLLCVTQFVVHSGCVDLTSSCSSHWVTYFSEIVVIKV